MVEDDDGVQTKISKWHWLVPLIVMLIAVIVGLLARDPHSDSFAKPFWYGVLGLVISSLISVVIYLAIKYAGKTPQKREFNTRNYCEKLITNEMRDIYFKEISTFVNIPDSSSDVVNSGADGKTKIYLQTFRIPGNASHYLLVAMNMEKGREDDRCHRMVPMNWTIKEREREIFRMCNHLADNPEKYRDKTKVFEDPFLGRRQTETTKEPIDDEEEEEE